MKRAKRNKSNNMDFNNTCNYIELLLGLLLPDATIHEINESMVFGVVYFGANELAENLEQIFLQRNSLL